VGKTSLGIELALHLETEIISADSRQCYKELNIGVAKPSPEQLRAARHHFINSHSIHDEVNAAIFEQYALDAVTKIFTQSDYALMVGGTGLYIKAFTEGMDAIPAIHAAVRERLIRDYEEKGLQWLQDTVQKEDPEFYAAGEMQNPQRMMRALEVKRFTGESVLSFRSNNKAARDFRIIKLGMHLPRERLYANINSRVDNMMTAGLLEEVTSLQPYQHLNALQTVGYQEIFKFLNQQMPLAQAVEEIKKNTRHYAKRQMTWFSKDKEIIWMENPTINQASSFIKKTT
jgi:tRNA dimethylallyltransferase